MKISFPFAVAGTVKLLRYQPMPPGNAPPPVPEGAFSLNSPSMLQSCGRSSRRHCESFRSTPCPLETSPSWKRQSWLNETLLPGRELATQMKAARKINKPAGMMLSFLVMACNLTTKLWFLGPLLLLLPLVLAKAQSTQIHSGWQFREVGKTDWYNATVPGCVHTDLLANKLIDDPFYRDNEKKQQWIDKKDWEYQTTFKVTPATVERENIELVFEGLDTYAGVYLNEQLVLKADNMFRTWRVNAKSTLKAGENTLRIVFRSPINEILPVMAKLNYQLPAPNDQGEKTSPYTRKAPYHYGWDWGPRFVTSGVWRPVSIEAWDHARVEGLQVVINKISPDVAELTANVEIEAATNGVATVMLENLTDKVSAGKQQINLQPGTNQVTFNFTVSKPKLWWPNGLGAQPLYSFRARSLVNGRITDEKIS